MLNLFEKSYLKFGFVIKQKMVWFHKYLVFCIVLNSGKTYKTTKLKHFLRVTAMRGICDFGGQCVDEWRRVFSVLSASSDTMDAMNVMQTKTP